MKYLGVILTGIKLLYLLSGLKSLVEKWQAHRQGAGTDGLSLPMSEEAEALEHFGIALAAFLALMVFALSFPDVRQAIADAPPQPIYGLDYATP